MDVSIFIAWTWFQWIAIRLALFLALLTLGPSLGLILFDILLYAYRTAFNGVTGKKDGVQVVKGTRVTQVQAEAIEVNEVDVVESVKPI